jgi:hypothetical protein
LIKATKPALPSTVLVHYINGEVETDANLLPFAHPPNPLARLAQRLKKKKSSEDQPLAQVRAASGVGASSLFRSQAEIEAELRRLARSVQHAQVASPSAITLPHSGPNFAVSDLLLEVEAFRDDDLSFASSEAEAFASSVLVEPDQQAAAA